MPQVKQRGLHTISASYGDVRKTERNLFYTMLPHEEKRDTNSWHFIRHSMLLHESVSSIHTIRSLVQFVIPDLTRSRIRFRIPPFNVYDFPVVFAVQPANPFRLFT